MKVSKVLLLDVDGVVCQNPKVFTAIRHKITHYVRKHMPGRMTLQEASSVNDIVYKTYGHTLLGLQAVRQKKLPTLDDFNMAIYDQQTLEFLQNNSWNPDMQKRALEVYDLCEEAKNRNIPIYLFSNAPYQWCKKVVDILELKTHLPYENILTSDHPVFQDGLLKPNPKVYRTITDYLHHKYQDKTIKFIFVDDSWMNLAPVIGSTCWTPLHLDNNASCRIDSRWVKTIHSLNEIHPLL